MKPIVIAALTLGLHVFASADESQRPDPKVPQGKNLDVPVGWVVRPDHTEKPTIVSADQKSADIWFVNMTPGWHITTGPAAILYHPASTATGNYRAEATIFLFDPEGRNEAYGIIFGGSDLGADSQSYDYFLIRPSREFLVKRRQGSRTQLIRDWTKSDAVKPLTEGEDDVRNVLAVECMGDEVAFYINGARVATLPRASLRTEGIVGLRVNHHVNVHVSDLSVTALGAD